MSALLSFLGGAGFRSLWGELSAAWTRHQEHKHELEMARLQAEQDAAQHQRMLETQKQAAELGIKTIEARGEIDLGLADINAAIAANNQATRETGIKWLDVIRGLVQPILAYTAIFLWISALQSQGFSMTEWDREIVAAIFGMYLANRHLTARGK